MNQKPPSRKTLYPAPGSAGALFLALLSFLIIAGGAGAPGIAWDEAVYIPASVNYVSWFGEIAEGFRDGEPGRGFSAETIHLHWRLNWEHPPLAKYAAAASMRVFSGFMGPVHAARISSAAMMSAAVLLCALLAGKIYGGYSGIFAGVFLLLMPRVFGHARLVSLDACVTSAWVLSAFLFVKAAESRKFILPAGIALGLALLSKLSAALVPFVFFSWAAVYRRKKEAKTLLPMLLAAAACVFLLWPWLWHFTFQRIWGYIHFHFFRGYLIPVFFLGRVYSASPAPFYYPLLLTAFTLPPAALAFLVYKMSLSLKCKFSNPWDGFIIMNAAAPILAAAIPFIGKYDGVRLFLPAFPFIAILAGAGLDRALAGLRTKAAGKACLPLAALLLTACSVPLFTLNPYHLSYYNMLCGGLRGARALGMETTYWGETMDSGVLEYLNENAPGNAKAVFYPAGSMVVSMNKLTGKLRDDIIETPPGKVAEACYLVLIHRQGMWTGEILEAAAGREPEYHNGSRGVRFTEVYRLK